MRRSGSACYLEFGRRGSVEGLMSSWIEPVRCERCGARNNRCNLLPPVQVLRGWSNSVR